MCNQRSHRTRYEESTCPNERILTAPAANHQPGEASLGSLPERCPRGAGMFPCAGSVSLPSTSRCRSLQARYLRLHAKGKKVPFIPWICRRSTRNQDRNWISRQKDMVSLSLSNLPGIAPFPTSSNNAETDPNSMHYGCCRHPGTEAAHKTRSPGDERISYSSKKEGP